jgi:hypothetical protein
VLFVANGRNILDQLQAVERLIQKKAPWESCETATSPDVIEENMVVVRILSRAKTLLSSELHS